MSSFGLYNRNLSKLTSFFMGAQSSRDTIDVIMFKENSPETVIEAISFLPTSSALPEDDYYEAHWLNCILQHSLIGQTNIETNIVAI